MLAGGLAACDPGAGRSPDGQAPAEASRAQFQFQRSSHALLRLDTSIGQVWFVPYGGQGGWTGLGDAPDLAGEPAANGRFRVYNLETRRRGLEPESVARLIRVDGATGRTWIVEVLDGARWAQIDEPGGGRLAAADSGQGASSDPAGTSAAGPPDPGPTDMTAAELRIVSREMLEADDAAAAEFATNLVQALEKEGMPPEVQAWSARQLAQFPREIAVPPLLGALDSEHPVVVVAAIHALAETGDPTTIPRIQRLENHPDPAVRAAVREVVVEVR
jgi:hypothetical protein